MAGTVDVRVRRDADEQLVLALITEKLSAVISMLTVQVRRSPRIFLEPCEEVQLVRF